MSTDERIKIKYRTRDQKDYPLVTDKHQPPDKEDAEYIEDVYKDGEIDFKLGDNIWVNKDTWDPFRLLQGWERKCVEAYCCGWLAYFDLEVKKGKKDQKEKQNEKKDSPFIHSIFFDWEDDEQNNQTTVTIYIKPQPVEVKSPNNTAEARTFLPANPPKPPPPPMG